MNPLFHRKTYLVQRTLVFVILSIALMTVDHYGNSYLQSIRGNLASLVSPLYHIIDFPLSSAHWVVTHLGLRTDLAAENHRLRRENLYLQFRLQRLRDVQAENERLQALLHSSAKITERALIGEIMGVDLTPYGRAIVINRGAADDVREHLPVVDEQGILGQIIHVHPFSSTALLLTDANHAIPVQVVRSGERTIAEGMGGNLLSLLYLPNTTDIQVGDALITSGLGGLFPSGYPVAEVVKVARNPGDPFVTAHARPVSRMERNREVLIIWSQLEATSPEPNDEPSE